MTYSLNPNVRLALNVLATVVAIYVPVAFVADWITERQQGVCQKTNVLRASVYDFERSAQDARARDYAKTGDQADLNAALAYEGLANSLVRAAAPFQRRAGRPELDCDEAFPPPLPWPD